MEGAEPVNIYKNFYEGVMDEMNGRLIDSHSYYKGTGLMIRRREEVNEDRIMLAKEGREIPGSLTVHIDEYDVRLAIRKCEEHNQMLRLYIDSITTHTHPRYHSHERV
jgi:hypothetical protein